MFPVVRKLLSKGLILETSAAIGGATISRADSAAGKVCIAERPACVGPTP
jgi:hypothetical protein